MRTKILLAVILCFGLGAPVAHSQASPYSNSVFPAKIFTGTGQTSTVIQLNGLVVPSTIGSSFASGTITVVGTSLTTATLSVLGSSDNGGTYYTVPITAVTAGATPTASITVTANGLYQVNLAGLTHIKFVTSGTFTATDVTVTLTASPNGQVSRVSTGSGSGLNQLTGDVAAEPGTGSQVATLATVNSNVGACGDATHVGQVTLDAKGRATGCTPVAISASGGSPGGSNGAIQYNNSGAFGGMVLSGLLAGNGAAAPAVATQLQFNSYLSSPGAIGGITPTSVNGVTLDTGLGAGVFLNGNGAYSSTSGISAKIKYLSVEGCPQNTDLNAGGGTDASACINALLAAATPSSPIIIVQDGDSLIGTAGVNIEGPASGNWAIVGNGGGVAKTAITNCAISGGVAILTANNSLTAGQVGTLGNLTHCPTITDSTVTVLSAGLSSTQFEVSASGSVSSGAEGPFATFAQVYGTGFYLASGANIDAIANGNFLSGGQCGVGGGIPPAQGANILWRDFVINGNKNGQSNYCFGGHIANINGLTIDNVTFYNASHFSLALDNVSQAVIHGINIYSSATPNGSNVDGVHVDGPASDIKISDSTFQTSDDSVAANAWEGYCGPITRFMVSNSTFVNTYSPFRAYTTDASVCPSNSLIPTVSKISLSNYSGSTTSHAAILGLGGGGASTTGTYPYAITDFKWANSTVEFVGGAASEPGFNIYDNVTDFTLENMNFVGLANLDGTLIELQGSVLPNAWGTFTLDNVRIIDTPGGNTFKQIFDHGSSGATSTLDAIYVNGFSVRGRGVTPTTTKPLFGFPGGGVLTVNYLSGVGIDPAYIGGYFSSIPTFASSSLYVPGGLVNAGGVVSNITPITKVGSSTAFGAYIFNESLGAYGGSPVTFSLPAVPQVGTTKCGLNLGNDNSALTIQATGGLTIADLAGGFSASNGFIVSAGAFGDKACVTYINGWWMVVDERGTWTTH